MNCPLCDHPNLPGNAECESCGASLTQEDIPRAVTLFERPSAERRRLGSRCPGRAPEDDRRDTTLDQAVATMRKKSIGCLVVTGARWPSWRGLLSERDLHVEGGAGDSGSRAPARWGMS